MRSFGGKKGVGQLETIWYEIDGRCADRENGCRKPKLQSTAL
jgi:hypothetical protein